MKTSVNDVREEVISIYKEIETLLIKMQRQAEEIEKRINILEQNEKDSK